MLVNKYVSKKKNLFMALLSIFIILNISGCSMSTGNKSNTTMKEITGKMTVDFIDVGKGDCILLRTDNYNVMIDTGYEETSDSVIDFLRNQEVDSIDVLIITHFDKDHVGGVINIMEAIYVDKIYMPDYVDSGNKYNKFINYLNKKGKMGKVNYLTSDTRLTIDEITFDMYAPKESSYKQENDYSIITKVTNKEDSFLFAGDAEEKRTDEVLGNKMLDCDVLKLPHHGELDKNVIQLMEEASPKYGVITCASESEVATSIVYELELLNAGCYFTCNGSVHMESNGDGNIIISQ